MRIIQWITIKGKFRNYAAEEASSAGGRGKQVIGTVSLIVINSDWTSGGLSGLVKWCMCAIINGLAAVFIPAAETN